MTVSIHENYDSAELTPEKGSPETGSPETGFALRWRYVYILQKSELFFF